MKVRVYGREETAGIGLSAFLEVGKGSLQESKLIVMEYMGDPGRPERRLGLIGKGLTYDSGGYSLQSFEFMETMGGCSIYAPQTKVTPCLSILSAPLIYQKKPKPRTRIFCYTMRNMSEFRL